MVGREITNSRATTLMASSILGYIISKTKHTHRPAVSYHFTCTLYKSIFLLQKFHMQLSIYMKVVHRL